MWEGKINLVAALITILQTLGWVFSSVYNSVPNIVDPINFFPLEFLDNPVFRFLIFITLELSLGWTFGLILVSFYLGMKAQSKIIVLLIPAVISAWVSILNVNYVLLSPDQVIGSVWFLLWYSFSFVIAFKLIGDHATKREKLEAEEIQLKLGAFQLLCFVGVFIVLSSLLNSNIYSSIL